MLTAIAIPVFTTQLEKSREATDMSNVRAAYAEAMADYLANGVGTYSATVTAKQTQADWQNSENGTLYVRIEGSESAVSVPAHTTKDSAGYTITVSNNSAGSFAIAVK